MVELGPGEPVRRAASGQYLKWDANGDGNGIIRKEGDELVFAEIEGPAVIWRTWSALAKEGHVKIYLDGAEHARRGPAFHRLLRRENAPFTYPALVHEAARGQNCYVPIPFQKSCKITATGDWGAYYHFIYTTYPKGTILPTFTRESVRRGAARARSRPTRCSRGAATAPGSDARARRKQNKQVTVPPGKTVTVAPARRQTGDHRDRRRACPSARATWTLSAN